MSYPKIKIEPMRHRHRAAVRQMDANEYDRQSLTADQLSDWECRRLFVIGTNSFVAIADGIVVGYCLLEKMPTGDLSVASLVVDPYRRRCGIGSQMVRYLINHVSNADIDRCLSITTNETELGAQLMLKQCGMRCIATLHAGDETDYLFQWTNMESDDAGIEQATA